MIKIIQTEENNLKQFIQQLPKTSIVTIISAILVYCLGKWYIWSDEANLIASLMVALWLGVNLVTKS